MTKAIDTPSAPAEPAARPAAPQTARTARAARDRAATEKAILTAVGEVLARDGFAAIGVNAISRQAGVDKVLIYRYFGGLSPLLEAWGASGRFWPDVNELLGSDPAAFNALPAAERYARFIEHFIDSLRARPLTLEILAAEVVERNELTTILEAEREAWGEKAGKLLTGDTLFDQRPELQGLTILLIAGVQYLLVRSRKIRIFGGIDIRSDAGWAELKQAARMMALAVVHQQPPDPH
ncbi:MAG: TetR/AcrR family transcriptional regulator [Rhizobacter sp.]|nr:TetR/AcrR family transcriptional regulator [Rhizobacter sp.]